MASIAKDKSGNRRILFVNRHGKRKTIYLGRTPAKIVATVKLRVEQLNSAQIAQTPPDDETLRWLGNVGEELSRKLAAVGLIAGRQSTTLAEFLDDYIQSRTDVKGSTATVYGHTRRCLVEFFGENRPLRDIEGGDADQWRLWLLNDQKLAENTVRRRCGIAKQFFRVAIRRKLISENPFIDLVAAVKANPKRFYFVTREEAYKVLSHCPNDEWRLLFALARFGGLRIPSEPTQLRWRDIDWKRGRMTVHAPKTEHHEGGESRIVPIFPELRPYLEAAFKSAEPGSEWAVACCRDPAVNLRTRLERIIQRAGLVPWPKLWQNLRSTRETELAETYPLHVVVKWIGNSQQIAAKHYLQLTDAHFDHAMSTPSGMLSETAEASIGTTHQTAQQGAEQGRRQMSRHPLPDTNSSVFPGIASTCDIVHSCIVGGEGLEPPTPSV